MADFTPDVLSQILAGKVAPPAPAPQPAAPILDPRFGRRAIPLQNQEVTAAIPSPNPTPIASGPGVSIPPTQIQSGPGVAVPAAMPTGMQPTVAAPDLQTASSARNIPMPDMNTPERIAANKTLNTPAPTAEQNRPKWWQRLAGAGVAGAMAFGHVPGALEAGQNVTDRDFNRAMGAWDTNQAQARGIVGEQDKQYGNLAKVYGQTLTNDFNRTREADRVAHNKELETTKDRLATVQEENAQTRRDKIDNQAEDKSPDGRAKLADKHGLKGAERSRYILTGKMDKERGAGDAIAEDRMDERRTKNLDRVQADADNAVKAHKAKIQARIDKLDETDPNYKTKLAQVERDDYQGMGSIGQQFASRSARFGEKFDAPKPEPWEQSNLTDSERQKLLGGAKSGKKTDEVKTVSSSQKFPLTEFGGHKAGEVVALKDGSKVKITGFNKSGQFSHVPAGN